VIRKLIFSFFIIGTFSCSSAQKKEMADHFDHLTSVAKVAKKDFEPLRNCLRNRFSESSTNVNALKILIEYISIGKRNPKRTRVDIIDAQGLLSSNLKRCLKSLQIEPVSTRHPISKIIAKGSVAGENIDLIDEGNNSLGLIKGKQLEISDKALIPQSLIIEFED
jgi:hypothetical protein